MSADLDDPLLVRRDSVASGDRFQYVVFHGPYHHGNALFTR
jgi:hypothetical protein